MAASLVWSSKAMVLLVLLGYSGALPVRAVAPIAQFIFGDSLVDQGNNNDLQSIAKANFKPNGIDMTNSSDVPTGRFCNGRLISDFISEYMGTPPVLAYLDKNANGQNLLRGCNFASAGSGILDDTGIIFAQCITFNQQIDNFEKVKTELIDQIGQAASDQLLAKALYAVTTGGNDFIHNYLLTMSARSVQYSLDDFTTLLINDFEGQLKKIYGLGARKFSISNIAPLGCIPDQLESLSTDGTCVEKINVVARAFNSQLKAMLDRLEPQLPGSLIAYSDSYAMVSDLVQNPSNYGFVSSDTACCGAGRFNGLIRCSSVTSFCTDRSKYLFWDAFHPTEQANYIFAQKLLYGPPAIISPMNLSQIIPL